MDELEISKIFGAGCAALLAFVGLGQLGSAVVSVDQLDEAAYVVEVPEAEGGEETEVAERMPIGQLMAMADVSAGPKVFKKCSACHKVEEGSSNGVGPMLYSVVGRDIGGVDGYSYSDTLAGMDGKWDFAALDGFLEAPKKWAPGTKMGFAGLSKEEDRASVIAWLNEQSASPLPMPTAEEETAEVSGETEEQSAKVEAADATVYEGDKEVEVTAEDVKTADVEAQETGDADVAAVKVVPSEEAADAEVEQKEEVAAVETDEKAVSEETTEEKTAEAVTEKPKAAEADTVKEKVAEAKTAEPKAEEPKAEEAATEQAEKAAEPKDTQVAAAKTEEAEKPAKAAAPAAAAASGLMALADMDRGAKVFKKCRACHKVEAGKNGVGPSLHGVVGRDIAAVDGFKYSDALSGKGGEWDVESLDAFLLKPKDWVPGTKMAFAGLRKDEDRASIIAWLNEQSDNPLPLE